MIYGIDRGIIFPVFIYNQGFWIFTRLGGILMFVRPVKGINTGICVIIIFLSLYIFIFSGIGFASEELETVISFTLMADIHYGDLPDTGRHRFFRASLDNVREVVEISNQKDIDFIVVLGDVVQESRHHWTTVQWLERVDNELKNFNNEFHYAIGNHDLVDLTKEQFIMYTSGQGEAPNYFFDKQGYRFIVLDPNFMDTGVEYNRGNFNWTNSYIPENQMIWLEEILSEAKDLGKDAIIFTHQALDTSGTNTKIRNAEHVRELFERKGNVLAIFQGHAHAGGYWIINGIHYVGVIAMVNGPDAAYAVVNILEDGSISVIGEGRQVNYSLRAIEGPPVQASVNFVRIGFFLVFGVFCITIIVLRLTSKND